MSNPSPVVSVLPGAGWYVEHELPNGTFWQEPLIGFMIHADGTGLPLIADAQGGVKCPAIIPGKSALVPPGGFLREASQHQEAKPVIDLELTIVRLVEKAGSTGVTAGEVAMAAHASEGDVKERLEYLRNRDLVSRSLDHRYSPGEPAHKLVDLLRFRFNKNKRS